MTEKELAALETAAKGATPGPWELTGIPDVVDILATTTRELIGSPHRMYNASYIAAANPAVVLDLIAELRQARADACEWIDMARWLAREMGGGVIPETQWLIIARQAVKEEREAAKEATCSRKD